MKLKWAMALVLGTGAVITTATVGGCYGGCVHEPHDSSAALEPAQSCVQIDVVHDQSGVELCGDGFSVGGVNNCAQPLSILTTGSADAGATESGDGGSSLGPGAQTFPPNSSIDFGLQRTSGRADADGTLHWDLPAELGDQSLVLHVTLGPKK